MRDNRDTSCKACATEKMGVRVTPDTLLFELLRAKNNANAASKTFKPIVQYYYVVLCEFESERKWIVGAVPTTWQKLKVFDENFVDKANTFLWHIYKKEDTFAWIDLSIDNTIYLLL